MIVVVFGRESKREREWRRRAERGDAEAAYALGTSYLAKSSRWPYWFSTARQQEAVRWLRRAADSGHVRAAVDLSRMAWMTGGWRDLSLIRYVKMVADAGDLEAAFRLGRHVERGLKGADARSSITAQEAQDYLRKAADGGHREAARRLGAYLATSEAPPTDDKGYFAQLARTRRRSREAERYLRLVADREDPDPEIARAYPDRRNLDRWEEAHRPTKLAEVELARLLWRTRRSQEAVKYYERALQSPVRGDDFADWARELAEIFEVTGRQVDAIGLRKRAIDVKRAWEDLL